MGCVCVCVTLSVWVMTSLKYECLICANCDSFIILHYFALQTFYVIYHFPQQFIFQSKSKQKENLENILIIKKTMMYPSYTLDCNLYTKKEEEEENSTENV